MKNRSDGFTMIELIIVIAIVAILAAVAFVAVNPAKRLMDSRNANRYGSVKAFSEAVVNYSLENAGLPREIDGNLRMVGTAQTGCVYDCAGVMTQDECLDLSVTLQEYMESLPIDPKGGTEEMSGYAIQLLNSNSFKLVSCYAEGEEGIEVVVK